MKKSTKGKATKRSKKKADTEKEDLPQLVSVMMKIAERLEALEKKMEMVISQTAPRPSETRHPSHERPSMDMPSHAPASSSAPLGSQPNRGRDGRVLHKAVCADCRKDCEVPFKPSGERPVYCKECFSKRKGGGAPKTGTVHPPQRPQPQVKITSRGPGKLVVAEVGASARDIAFKKKHHKASKKAKR